MKLTVAAHEMGFVVIANDAVLSVLSKTAVESFASTAGGALGGLAAGAYGKRGAGQSATPSAPVQALSALKGIQTCTVADLPAEVRASSGWPKVEAFRPVTIYPRQSISGVKVSIWRGLVVQVAGRSYPMAIQMWQVGKAKKHLAEAGYRFI